MAALGLYYFFPKMHFGVFLGLLIGGVIVGEIAGAAWTRKCRAEKKPRSKSAAPRKAASAAKRASIAVRSDEEILGSGLDRLSGPEFERLLALYFRDQGYTVHEVGVGGNDGGVDLVIVDRRGEKTAVQAKCYADGNMVPVQTVRELVGAKRNHDCILALLITTSDLTGPAKKEADDRKVEYWHGGIVEQKLRAWGKWSPGSPRNAKPRSAAPAPVRSAAQAKREVAAGSAVACRCGAPMVKRKGKDGTLFWGCSTFPACRHTKTL
ncbi:restriction endonuclease [Paenibacillus sp.]|uniref:restriction endonuclease n=1 Tax=Paenibacillus sp. TaxID=58172 RepID=UPI002811632E|nr:restriction endonuclease [Paenibacillus sp.]